MWWVQLLAVILLLVIFYQDHKERLVHGALFPATAVLLGILHYYNVETTGFYTGVAGNVVFISLLLLILFLYSRIKLKMPFINGSFGLGDMLFFYAVCIGFPNVAFGILFVFSVFFSFAMHLLLKRLSEHTTIPLAGYMALFFAMVLLTDIFFDQPYLYLI